MKRTAKLLCLLVSIVLVLGMFAACTQEAKDASNTTKAPEAKNDTKSDDKKEETKPEDVTLRVLNVWNGSSGPDDSVNNPVAKVLKEKLGITVEFEYGTTSEIERLNLMFASGDMPDLVHAPFWGGNTGETTVLKKAAIEGLIMPLDQYKDKYNLRLDEGIMPDIKENDFENPEYNGNHYFLYGYPFDKEVDGEPWTWTYGVFARKDVLETVGVEATDVHTSEDLYNLIKKVKESGITDFNGGEIIPAGTLHNGWSFTRYFTEFKRHNFSTFVKDEEGNVKFFAFDPLMEQQGMFMRKLISEGLFDMECFNQTDAIAKEKIASGKIAFLAFHAPEAGRINNSIFSDQPEHHFVPLGPLYDANGECVDKVLDGMSGGGVSFIPATTSEEKVDAIFRWLQFCETDKGYTLTTYGIEGEHYDVVDGKIVPKPEIMEIRNDHKQLANLGLNKCMAFALADKRKSLFGELSIGAGNSLDPTVVAARELKPYKMYSGYRLNYLGKDYENKEDISEALDEMRYYDVLKKTFFADSDEEVLEIINDYRAQLIAEGIQDYEQYLTEQAAQRDDVLY